MIGHRFLHANQVRRAILDAMDRADRRRNRYRRRPDGGMPAMAEPPRGPLPLQGGAEAPLEFDD
jgi:hypothetical protein